MRLSVPFRVSASSWGTAPAPRRLAGCCLDGQQRRASACPRPGHARLIGVSRSLPAWLLRLVEQDCGPSSASVEVRRLADRPSRRRRHVACPAGRGQPTAMESTSIPIAHVRGWFDIHGRPILKAESFDPEEAMTERPAIAPVRRRPGRYRRLETRGAEQRPRGSVVPQRRGDQKLIAVLSGPLNGQPSEHRPDAETLQVVREGEGDMRRRRPRSVSRVASDANDRVPVAVDRCQRIVVDVVEVREVGELAGLETRLRERNRR